jgi:hypothetical protein
MFQLKRKMYLRDSRWQLAWINLRWRVRGRTSNAMATEMHELQDSRGRVIRETTDRLTTCWPDERLTSFHVCGQVLSSIRYTRYFIILPIDTCSICNLFSPLSEGYCNPSSIYWSYQNHSRSADSYKWVLQLFSLSSASSQTKHLSVTKYMKCFYAVTYQRCLN